MCSLQLSQEKERMILDAAQSRFARFGFSKVTMDEIAEDIGMAKASLYYYYPAKDDVFRAVIRREQEEFLRQTATILDSSVTASQKLRAYVNRRIVLAGQLANLSALNVKFWQEMKPKFKDLFVAFAQEELQSLKKIIAEGKASGEFAVPSPEKTAELLLHLLHGLRLRLSQHAQFHGDGAVRLEEFEQETNHLLDLVLNGILNKTERQKGSNNQ